MNECYESYEPTGDAESKKEEKKTPLRSCMDMGMMDMSLDALKELNKNR